MERLGSVGYGYELLEWRPTLGRERYIKVAAVGVRLWYGWWRVIVFRLRVAQLFAVQRLGGSHVPGVWQSFKYHD